MIIYWLSQDSNITPPVCVSAYAAAAIAQGDPWKTGWASFKFAKMLYVMPLLFAFTPMLYTTGTWDHVLVTWFSALLGTIAFGALTVGYLQRTTTVLEWVVLAAATFLCYYPDLWTDIIGVGLVTLLWLFQKRFELSFRYGIRRLPTAA
jgi:TRAP-type uncharacterized transport system fused permease subunit